MKTKTTSVILPAYSITSLPRAVYVRSQQLPPGHCFELHSHPWNQLVYATSGSLVVTVETTRYVITPQQAIWLPTKTLHASGTFGGAAFKSLYIADNDDLQMPSACSVLSVSPLLHELITELPENADREDESYQNLLEALIIMQLRRARRHGFSLPWPQSQALRQLCEALYNDPGSSRTADQWGRELATTPRTLARRFEAELGMNLRAWRGRLRLFRSLEWLSAGHSITKVAFDLGYNSPSAFAFMFRQEMHCSPSEWRSKHSEAFLRDDTEPPAFIA